MESELIALEEKINQFVQLCQRLRTENVQLRQQLVTVVNENRQLSEKVNGAKIRLETLLNQIPEGNE
ncbi:hypothetical protein [Sulfurirhabdus autotrophica]|uniref:Cell division protein ZapB n=1 Tax=Sulfurirhabdus autotrophica TaxID=1706046 RepID=A0A4R3Y0W9_9PROT|nr:hypothetical protein [Sulfurirhabdus autotrophica]TCV84298.1 cell division protein ZapB [Sulfurirhabdus autotrophica]